MFLFGCTPPAHEPTSPVPMAVIAPPPAPTTTAGPVVFDPGPLARRDVSLRDLYQVPSQTFLDASTFELRALPVPPGGIRESRDGVQVPVVENETGVWDGLRDQNHVFLTTEVDQDTREVLADIRRDPEGKSYQKSRLVQIVFVDATRVSAWIGTSSYYGGAAHSNNRLECGTWSRTTGKRLRLSALIPDAAARLKRVADIRARAAAGDDEEAIERGLYLDQDYLDWPAANTQNVLVDGPGAPLVCMPVDVGPGGETVVFRLGF